MSLGGGIDEVAARTDHKQEQAKKGSKYFVARPGLGRPRRVRALLATDTPLQHYQNRGKHLNYTLQLRPSLTVVSRWGHGLIHSFSDRHHRPQNHYQHNRNNSNDDDDDDDNYGKKKKKPQPTPVHIARRALRPSIVTTGQQCQIYLSK